MKRKAFVIQPFFDCGDDEMTDHSPHICDVAL